MQLCKVVLNAYVSNIGTISVYLAVSLAFMLLVFYLLAKRRSRHQEKYPKDWDVFKDSLDRNDIEAIRDLGNRIVWNDYLLQEHKEIIYREVGKRKGRHPELNELWGDVYFKMHGIELEKMEPYQYILTCELPVKPENFGGIEEKLEITIPCTNCQRGNRTIIFEAPGAEGICTPREKCDGFPGKLTYRKVIEKENSVIIRYWIDFDYAPFIDRKHGVQYELTKHGWARVHFTLTCNKCNYKKATSTQENRVRPREDKCNCMHTIYREKESPFTYNADKRSNT